jgi:hypothetical protein
MSDNRHSCVYCYNSFHGNAAKQFSTLLDNDYRTICVSRCHGKPVKGFSAL